jgi:hypothetical protein
MKNHTPFQYIETDDREMLAKYVEMRRRVFRNEYSWLPEEFGSEDEIDRVSHIVLAVHGNLVGGGARLTIATPECPRPMPLEEGSVILRDCEFLTQLDLRARPYGEISRMAVDPDCARGFEVSAGLGNALCARAASEGLDVVFSICPEKPARINHINAKRRGVEFHRYRELPTVFGVNMWLCAFTGLLRVYGREEREVA